MNGAAREVADMAAKAMQATEECPIKVGQYVPRGFLAFGGSCIRDMDPPKLNADGTWSAAVLLRGGRKAIVVATCSRKYNGNLVWYFKEKE